MGSTAFNATLAQAIGKTSLDQELEDIEDKIREPGMEQYCGVRVRTIRAFSWIRGQNLYAL
jgi:hypothetical protein